MEDKLHGKSEISTEGGYLEDRIYWYENEWQFSKEHYENLVKEEARRNL